MDNISIEDKVKIASGFLLSSPPGEVNDVFNGNWNCALPALLGLEAYICYFLDVRTLVNNDEGLQDGILQALEQYNTEQHITATLPGSEHEVKNSTKRSRDEV